MSDTQLEPREQPEPTGKQEHERPEPEVVAVSHRASSRLANKVALISGGGSGIGRAVAVGFANEGADVIITYLDEHDDARTTLDLIGSAGVRGLAMPGDIGDSAFSRDLVAKVVEAFGRIDILVNNAAEHHAVDRLEDLKDTQLERTFRTNILGHFFLTRAALPYMPDGSAIINTTSVTAYQGSASQLDVASTMGAIVGFTRSLAKQLLPRRIRVNGVAPGPTWTPFDPPHPDEQVAMGLPNQPDQIAPCYIFLASDDAAAMTGQVLHPNGGIPVNG